VNSKKDCNFRVKFVSGCKGYAKRLAHRLARRRADRDIRAERAGR
jgi:hypothetical protein